MGKDPAVLFYTADFLSGTILMDYEQRGKYITLLCLQHQKGILCEKDMFKICGEYDEDIFSKFVKSDDGFYYNKRMFDEAEKRKKYSESRSNNRKKKKSEDMSDDECDTSKSYVPHMGNENENRNENRNNTCKKVKRVYKKKEFIPPTFEDVLSYAKERNREDLAKKFYDYFTAGDWVDSNGKKVERWKAKFITWENNTEKPQKIETESSFDVDDFFGAALRRSYGDDWGK